MIFLFPHQIRSLLFGAVFSDGRGSITGDLPTVVCASDTEEDGGVDDRLW